MSRTRPDNQFTIKSVVPSKGVIEKKYDLTTSKQMIDHAILSMQNLYIIQQSVDAIASISPGYKGPKFHSLCDYLLAENVEEVENYVDNYYSTWKKIGCTIITDSQTKQYKRTLINFIVYCPKETIFLKG